MAVVVIHDPADDCCGLVITGGSKSSLKDASTAFAVAGVFAGCSGHTDFWQRMAMGYPEKMAFNAVDTAG